jgi:hypothetical protein
MTYGLKFLHPPPVCFELESRDVKVGLFFSNSDSVYDLLLVTATTNLPSADYSLDNFPFKLVLSLGPISCRHPLVVSISV